MNRIMSRLLASLLLLAMASVAAAAPSAWLDRARIVLGDTVTLNIESETSETPDFAALDKDFLRRGQSSSTQTTIANGSVRTRTLWAVALEPRQAGSLSVPAITIGKEQTEPLPLTVSTGQIGAQAQGQDVFLEVQVDQAAPYVGQPVMYTLRLSYAITLLDGDLEPPSADGVDIRRIGDDASYQRSVAGRRYQTLERRFVLTPEHSGPLQLLGARFRGRTLAGLRDPVFGGARAVSALGEAVTLQVQAQPVQAQQPWLPAISAALAMQAPDDGARAGEPVNIELQLHLQGAGAAQVPELQLPAIDGARVFPDTPQVRERLVDGVLTVDVTRRFAVLPARAGELTIPAVVVPWWNTLTHAAQTAQSDSATLQVAAAANGADNSPPALAGRADSALPATITNDVSAGIAAPPAPVQLRSWQGLSLLLLLLWMATLAWGWRRGKSRSGQARVDRTNTAKSDSMDTLRRAASTGDLATADDALRALAAGREVDALPLDPAQRQALAALRSALWGGGDRQHARALLRDAFAKGLKLSSTRQVLAKDELLPPLYPDR